MLSAYFVLKWLHIIAAAYLVGSFVTEWALRAYVSRFPDRHHKAFAWGFLVKGEERVAIPFAGLLLVTGLLMVWGPASAGWSITEDLWIAAGLGIFLTLLVLMAGVAGNAAKRVHAVYAGEGDVAAAAPHEKFYARITATGLVLVLTVVWLMVAKPF